jgi:hypothetical protein
MSDNPDIRELAEIPAVEVISRAAVMLMSAAAEKLGLSAADQAHLSVTVEGIGEWPLGGYRWIPNGADPANKIDMTLADAVDCVRSGVDLLPPKCSGGCRRGFMVRKPYFSFFSHFGMPAD